ncbi:MAG: hypothetical protein AAF317_18930 [Pseudomonadota bacterium]
MQAHTSSNAMDKDDLPRLRFEIFQLNVDQAFAEMDALVRQQLDDAISVPALICALIQVASRVERDHPESLDPGYLRMCLQDLLQGGDGIVPPRAARLP